MGHRARGVDRGVFSLRRAEGTSSNSFISHPASPILEWQWVAFDTPDARELLDGRQVLHAHHPTNRNLRNLARNTVLAWRVVRRTRPAVAISTGAGVAVPFLWIARIYGARVIYVESFARTSGLSLTGRLVRPVVHRLFVQWPGAEKGAKAEYVGSIF